MTKLAEIEFQKSFLNIFEFTLSFFHYLLKRWANKLIESSLLHIFCYIIPSLHRVIFTSYFLLYYTQFSETLWDNGDSTPWKNLGLPMLKQNMTNIFRKTESLTQHPLFLCLVKLILRMSNFFLHLVEITFYQK